MSDTTTCGENDAALRDEVALTMLVEVHRADVSARHTPASAAMAAWTYAYAFMAERAKRIMRDVTPDNETLRKWAKDESFSKEEAQA